MKSVRAHLGLALLALALPYLGASCTQSLLLQARDDSTSSRDAGPTEDAADSAAPPTPEAVAIGLRGVLHLALSATHVFASSYDSAAFYVMPKGGGASRAFSRHNTPALGVTSDGRFVWAGVASDSGGASPGLVLRFDLSNLDGSPTAVRSDARLTPWSLAQDDTDLFIGTSSQAIQLPKQGGAERVLGGAEIVTSLTISGGDVAWVSALGGEVFAARKGGGPVRTLYKDRPQALVGVTSDETSVYVLHNEGPTTRVVSVPWGGGPATTLSTVQQSGFGILVDERDVYFTSLAGGLLQRVAKRGGATELLAVNVVGPETRGGALVGDATHVYWSTGDGAILRRRKR